MVFARCLPDDAAGLLRVDGDGDGLGGHALCLRQCRVARRGRRVILPRRASMLGKGATGAIRKIPRRVPLMLGDFR